MADQDPLDPPDSPTEGPPAAGTVGFVADVVRKAVLTGVGALFLTEEGARKLAREWKLPKELAAYLVQQAQGAKDEVLRMLGQETRRFLESETFRRELVRLLGSMTVEVQAEIRLKQAAPGRRPRTRVRVRPSSRRAAGKAGPAAPAGDPNGGEGA